MKIRYRLVELPQDAIKAHASSEHHPLHHFVALLASRGVNAELTSVIVPVSTYAALSTALTSWLRERGLRTETVAVPMPKVERRCPRGHVLVPVAAETVSP